MSSFLLLLLLFAFLLDLGAVPAQSAKGRQLGAFCSQDRDCSVPYSRCSASQCSCQPYYARYNATRCLPSSLLGFDCLVREQCSLKVANSSCIDGMCRCEPGFLQFRRHTCLSPARPGDVCYSDAHCRLWDSDSHCRFLIPKLFGRCACNKPLILRGDACIHAPEDLQPPPHPPKVTLSSASLWAFTTQTTTVSTTSPSSPPITTTTETPTTTTSTIATPSPAKTSNVPETTTRQQEVPISTTLSDHFFYSSSHVPVSESSSEAVHAFSQTESSSAVSDHGNSIGTEKPSSIHIDTDPTSSSTETGQLQTVTPGTVTSDSQESSSGEDDSSMEEEDSTDDEESEKEDDSSSEEEPYGTTRVHMPSSTERTISSTSDIQIDDTITDINTAGHLDQETVSSANLLSTSSDPPVAYTHDTSSEGTTESESAPSFSSTENAPSSLPLEDRKRIQGITEASTDPDSSVNSKSSTTAEYGNLILTTSAEDFTFADMEVAATSYITGHSTPRKAAISLGMVCVSDMECRLSDLNSRCVNGVCDCAVKTNGSASCGATNRGCHPGTFQCRSTGACVSWFFVCDGRRDCADGSDEECDGSTECPAMSFKCGRGNGKCVSRSMRCDGNKDCPDGEDEAGCNQRSGCPAHTFPCAGGGVGGCVPDYELCNAVLSCPDGSDEPVWCRAATPYGRRRHRVGPRCPYRCDNGRCRSTAILCSGRDGCGDGSDEAQCSVCKCPSA